LAIEALRAIRPSTRLLEVSGWLQHYRDRRNEMEDSFDSGSSSDSIRIFDLDQWSDCVACLTVRH
jgi:hypothetical protein